jgi:hypothetical protein
MASVAIKSISSAGMNQIAYLVIAIRETRRCDMHNLFTGLGTL